MAKKALLIAHSFAPLLFSATMRPLKFAKYLPDFGWQPYVLTIDPGLCINHAWNRFDPALLDDIPAGVDLYTTMELDPVKLGRLLIRHLPGQQKKTGSPELSAMTVTPTPTILRRLEHIYLNWFSIPDNHIWWYPSALQRGLAIIRREKIDAIFTTAPAFTTHLVGLRLKQLTGKPWVADFRDNWTRSGLWQYPTSVHRRVHRFLERRVFLEADKITTIQPDVCAPDDPVFRKNKFVNLVNGFDEADFASIKYTPAQKFTITHTGTFYGTRTPENFLRAFTALLQEHPELRPEMQVRFLGPAPHVNIMELVTQLHLADVVHCGGFVPHRTALQEMVNADVLLLILHNTGHDSDRTIYPGKLFEYLGAGRPILGLAPIEGAAADVIRQTGSGIVVPTDDLQAIKATLYTLYKRRLAGTLNVASKRDLTPYSWHSLTNKLAVVLDEVLTLPPQIYL